MTDARDGAGTAKAHRIAILDDYNGIALELADWSTLRDRAAIEVFRRPLRVPDEAAEALAPFTILCTLRERMPIPRALIERLPALRMILVTGKRYDTVDLAAVTERGIVVANTPSIRGGGSVVELVWGLIVAVARRLPLEDRTTRAGGWQTGPGTGLRGKTLGILGFGGIGRRVAEVGRAFGMDVIAWGRSLTDAAAAEAGVERVDRDDLYRRADVITIHTVLAEGTRGMVDRRAFSLMKPTAILINTARGPIVEEAALVEALRSGRIRGAGLDVYDVEPLPADHPLLALDNVVLSPHLGYYVEDTLRGFYQDAVRTIGAFVDGTPTNVVNPSVSGR